MTDVPGGPAPVKSYCRLCPASCTVLPGGRWDVAPELLVQRMDEAAARPAHDLVLGNRREVRHTNSTLAWGCPACRSARRGCI